MSISIQTNVTSLIAQQNLNVNTAFQSRTIQRLTSGYRINSSGDDAAGLSVANKFRSDISELQQGVLNANDGISGLQIVDGGLNNISQILDRLKTLATESSTGTFTGNRDIVNSEYQSLLKEVDRQAANVGLVSGGFYNKVLSVYIGGGSSQDNAQVNVDLSGPGNHADSTGLGISQTNVAGSGSALTGNSVRLDNNAITFLAGGASQVFSFNTYSGGAATSQTITVTGTPAGLNGADVVNQLNSVLNASGITASIATQGPNIGQLEFSGAGAFSVKASASVDGTVPGANAVAGAASETTNSSDYQINTPVGTFAAVTAGSQIVNFANSQGSAQVTFDITSGSSVSNAIAAINAKTSSLGIYAVADAAGTGFSIQSANNFTATETTNAGVGNGDVFGLTTPGGLTVAPPTPDSNATSNAQSALTAINNAISILGAIQGRVGAGQNDLQYAVQLAQSQITSYSAGESRIRDADVASEASNLTKAQVLQQASIAAMAQANQTPQAVLSLLKG